MVSETLELTVNTRYYLTETLEISLKSMALIEDLTLKYSGHLIIYIVKAICIRNPSTVG
jgi:hypothetical protein